MTKDKQFDFEQLYWRRKEAKDQYQALRKEYETLRVNINDLDKELKLSDPAETKEVRTQMERITFLKGEIHDGLNAKTESFAKDEVKARLDILFEKLQILADYRGHYGWRNRLDWTVRYYEVQTALGKIQESIVDLDYQYFTHVDHDKHHPSAQPIEVPDDVLEQWAEELKLSDQEVFNYELEAWVHDEKWNQISAESTQRALDELRNIKDDKDNFEHRMKEAMNLEREIESARRNLEFEVSKLLEIQKRKQTALQSRIRVEEQYHETSQSLNREIHNLESYFEDIIPSSIWPDYIIANPIQAYDPKAAQDFQDTLEDELSFDEKQEFHTKQYRLKELRKNRLAEDKRIKDNRESYTKEINLTTSDEDTQREVVEKLRHELNVLNGRRGAELKVAVKRVPVAGEEQILPPSEDATVEVEGVSAKGETGRIVEGSATVSFGFNTTVSAEVEEKAKENIVGLDNINADISGNDEIFKALQHTLAQTIKVPAIGKRIIPDRKDTIDPVFVEAVNMLNAQHEANDLEGKEFEFTLKRGNHAKLMLAFRCGIWVNNSTKVVARVISRLEGDGNTLFVHFPKSQTTGHLSVKPNIKTGDWEIATIKNPFPDWPEWAMTTPGVPPMAKIDTKIPHYEYIRYYHLIQKRIDAHYEQIDAEYDKKMADG